MGSLVLAVNWGKLIGWKKSKACTLRGGKEGWRWSECGDGDRWVCEAVVMKVIYNFQKKMV